MPDTHYQALSLTEQRRGIMADGDGERPLKKMVEAFKDLASTVHSQNKDVEVGPFCEACSLVSPLIGSLGSAFEFAESDFAAKVNDLSAASESISTLQSILDEDVKSGTVQKVGSHSRNLLRVRRGLDTVKVLFEQILTTEGNSFKEPATSAYSQALAPHHGWAIHKAVGAGLGVLNTKAQLLRKLNEDENCARNFMQEYISASVPVIAYIDNLFLSRGVGIDW